MSRSCRSCSTDACPIGQFRTVCDPYNDGYCTACTNLPIDSYWITPGMTSLGFEGLDLPINSYWITPGMTTSDAVSLLFCVLSGLRIAHRGPPLPARPTLTQFSICSGNGDTCQSEKCSSDSPCELCPDLDGCPLQSSLEGQPATVTFFLGNSWPPNRKQAN